MWLLEALTFARQWLEESGSVVLLLVLLWRVELVRREVSGIRAVVKVLELGHSGDRTAHAALPQALEPVSLRARR
jgi:hypothetical protein